MVEEKRKIWSINSINIRVKKTNVKIMLNLPHCSIKAVTFCGCGFLGIYLVGAATCLQQHRPRLLQGPLGGSSVGSLIATCLVCDVPLQVLYCTYPHRYCIIDFANVCVPCIMTGTARFTPCEFCCVRRLYKAYKIDSMQFLHTSF